MNAKPIPIIMVLASAALSCIASVIQRASFAVFTKRLFLSVVIFAIIGSVVRVVIERSFKIMEPEEIVGEENEEEVAIQDISSEEEERESEE